jgi:hypothetical protein
MHAETVHPPREQSARIDVPKIEKWRSPLGRRVLAFAVITTFWRQIPPPPLELEETFAIQVAVHIGFRVSKRK